MITKNLFYLKFLKIGYEHNDILIDDNEINYIINIYTYEAERET